MSHYISRGDVFYANLYDGIGSEQRGFRPVIIIQNDTGNHFSPTVIAIAVTRNCNPKAKLPTHCNLTALTILGIPSMALAEQIVTLDKALSISVGLI